LFEQGSCVGAGFRQPHPIAARFEGVGQRLGDRVIILD